MEDMPEREMTQSNCKAFTIRQSRIPGPLSPRTNRSETVRDIEILSGSSQHTQYLPNIQPIVKFKIENGHKVSDIFRQAGKSHLKTEFVKQMNKSLDYVEARVPNKDIKFPLG